MLKTNDVKFDMKVGSRKYVGLKRRRHYHFLYCKNGGLKILIKSEMGHIANDVSVKNLN